MENDVIKSIEQAEEAAIKACNEKGIRVGPDDVIEIEFKKRSSIWEVEFIYGKKEVEVKMLGVDGRIISIEEE